MTNIRREFSDWLSTGVVNIPIIITPSRKTSHVEFTFGGGYPPNLVGSVTKTNLNVAAMIGDELLDWVYDDDLDPEQDSEGFFCRLCLPEFQQRYATAELLRREHLFSHFKDWVSNSLMPARWFSIHQSGEGGSSFALLRPEPPIDRDCRLTVALPEWPAT